MNIRIFPNSGRRIAWTDRVNGYFEIMYTAEKNNNGYYRGDKKYISGFEIKENSFNNMEYTDVYPEGFRSVFNDDVLDCALLINEQAFYIYSQKCICILGMEAADNNTDNSYKNMCSTSDKKTQWNINYENGICVLSSSTGFAAAASFNFNYKLCNSALELHKENPVSNSSTLPFTASGWYAVFEENEQIAKEKAVRLALSNAVEIHKKLIYEFLGQCTIDSGNPQFNDAVQWARFSAWMLCVKNKISDYRGIWAGLPWFRDNWGRDTFISLCGILLVSGCFDEAREVLLGFAEFQDKDKDSPSFGRIPNRYRNSDDVIYNTADGTLWFIRSLWEYVQYSGDTSILKTLEKTVICALDADITRTDEHGFLMHGDADTWMDARINGNQALSARGNRANDIQALWFTALRIGEIITAMHGNLKKSKEYALFASKVKKSFYDFFWHPLYNALADRLPEGSYGEWAKDMKVRPNQLFALTAPFVLPRTEENRLLPDAAADKILNNVNQNLVTPYGLFTLCSDDPLFHAEHENNDFYNKDAAYHNGTIWEWISGIYISAETKAVLGNMPSSAFEILKNETEMILEQGCAGTLSENIHAKPAANGKAQLSGTFSQAWSLAEYIRNVFQDIAGFIPRLAENEIEFNPHLPQGYLHWKANIPFGQNWIMEIAINIEENSYCCLLTWKVPKYLHNFPKLKVNGLCIEPEKTLNIKIPFSISSKYSKKIENSQNYIKNDFPPEWCASSRYKNYLEQLILSGRMESKTCGGYAAAALEKWFNSKEFKEKYLTDLELGAVYSKESTFFRLWSPSARNVKLVLYPDGTDSCEMQVLQTKCCNGVWEICISRDMYKTYYCWRVLVHGLEADIPDPYAKACGVNGMRSMVLDTSKTNPAGWEKTFAPSINSPCDAVIYETHVADITSSDFWNGPKNLKRLFTGAACSKISYGGKPAGFDHICSMGITHVQLLPIFDFKTVDEKRINDESYKNRVKNGLFNWGYDPQNYGVPEGSYSSNPYDGEVRIRELKSLIKAFADKGIGIIMDVVFNHVKDGLYHPFGMCVPGYYFRLENYSGAGEDTASEREMFRKYMINMLCYWLKEYKLCGFRFDLMGLHDVETMNEICCKLRKIKKDVLIYGEGWDMYRGNEMEAASMSNSHKMKGIGFFNDAFRCGIKGSVFNDRAKGFIHNGSCKESVKFGIVGTVSHPDVDNTKVEGTANPNPWGDQSWVSVNYTEIHDNITLFDKLNLVEPHKSIDYYKQMQKTAISLILFAQGIPILHAGMEFMRTKEVPKEIVNPENLTDIAWLNDYSKAFFRNSYNICDKFNCLDWKRCAENQDIVDYVRALIAVRKNHPAFRITSGEKIAQLLTFIDNNKTELLPEILAWKIDGKKCGDSWKNIIIIVNPLNEKIKFTLPLPKNGNWHLITDGYEFNKNIKALTGEVYIKPKAAAVYAEF